MAAAINDFDGTQPVLRQSPPIFPFSTRTTGTPKAAAAAATVSPPAPAPMTQMSGVNISAMTSLAHARSSGTRRIARTQSLCQDWNEREHAERRERRDELP